jgi:hypothetical protein
MHRNDESGSRRQFLREREWWLLVCAIVLFFGRQLTTGTFYFRDLYQLIYPKRLELLDALRRWEVPLWDPLSHGGQPFLAEPSHSVFYPSNILYAVLKPIAAFNVAIVLQYLLAALGAYFLARTMRLSKTAALTTGAIYAFCGFALSTANLMPLGLALPWIPLTLAFAQRALRGERGFTILGAAFCAAMPLIGGSAEGMGMLVTILVAWTWSQRRTARPRGLTVMGIIIAAALGLSLVQTLPAAEVIANSSRSSRRSYESFSSWSVPVRRLPELVIPQYFGRTDSLDESAYWGSPFETQGFPYVLSLYFGIPALFLALYGGLYRERVPVPAPVDSNSSKPESSDDRSPALQLLRRTLLAIMVAAIVLSLGRVLPGFKLIYELPLVSIFRYPVKIIFLSLVPLALLAGFGIDRLRSDSGRRLMAAYAASAGVLASLTLSLQLRPLLTNRVTAFLFLQPLAAPFRDLLLRSLWHTTAAAIAAAIVLLMPNEALRPRMLALLILIDLGAGGFNVNAVAPRRLFDPPPVAEAVRALVGDARFHHSPDSVALRMRARTDDLFWLARRNLEVLNSYSATAFGIPVVFHGDYDGLAPAAVAQLGAIADTLPWRRRIALYEAAGIRAFISTEDVRLPGVQRSGPVRDRAGAPSQLYSLPEVQRVRLARVIRWEPTPERVLDHMTRGDFHAGDVVLSGQVGEEIAPCREGALLLRQQSRNSTEVEIDSPCAGYLYFAETYYPGWRASIDGNEIPLLRANYAFTAVHLPAGHHFVKKYYRPRLPVLGALGTLLTALALTASLFSRRGKRFS